jgi:hypothetical protein
MDINTFYAVTSATCFTLVGLWWSVVKDKAEWLKDEATRRLAGGIYASFLIPALMSLGAQVGGDNRLVWHSVAHPNPDRPHPDLGIHDLPGAKIIP